MTTWLLTPMGSLVARDGRPFGSESGNRMRLTPWFYPSVAAGSYRTLEGKSVSGGFTAEAVGRLKRIQVAGPLPHFGRQLYFPAPRDIVRGSNGEWLPLRPASYGAGEGTDLPLSTVLGARELLPVMLPDNVAEDFKPLESPPWWSLQQLTTWLLDKMPEPPGARTGWSGAGYMGSPVIDVRAHVVMDAAAGAAADGLLFQSAGYQFEDGVKLAVRTSTDNRTIAGIHPFGGERRLAAWQPLDRANIWDCPSEVAVALVGADRLRMILATPAVFGRGWVPNWIGSDWIGVVPGTDLKVRLVGASVDRWKPVSGWSLDSRDRGEKPVRRLAPAGATYFFERVSGMLRASEAWLQPVSDEEQACFDGFGLALWGCW